MWDYVKVEGTTMIHRQVEFRNGLTYMRAKKRPVMLVSRA